MLVYLSSSPFLILRNAYNATKTSLLEFMYRFITQFAYLAGESLTYLKNKASLSMPDPVRLYDFYLHKIFCYYKGNEGKGQFICRKQYTCLCCISKRCIYDCGVLFDAISGRKVNIRLTETRKLKLKVSLVRPSALFVLCEEKKPTAKINPKKIELD